MRPPRLLLLGLVAVLALGAGDVATAAASDPYRSQQWNVDRVEAPMAWEISRGAGIRVAVVDTGIDLEHPELATRIARRADGSVLGHDFIDDDGDPSDENGHGTLVAGVVAAVMGNGEGIAGIAPDAKLMPLRVLDADGAGDGADVDRAIRWAADNGAHVINLSLESAESGPRIDLPISAPTSAVQYAWDKGVIVVAAAGNDASTSDDYPASSPIVLVGATTRDDRRADFSDTGRTDAVMAPGVDIISTLWCDPAAAAPTPACQGSGEHGYGEATGTSFAAPHVSGALAILRASGLTHTQAVQRLRDTARDIGAPGPDEDTGVGLIHIAAAVGAKNPPSSPSPSPTASPSPSPAPTAPPPGGSPSPRPPAGTSPPPPATSPSPEPSPEPTGEPPSPSPTTASGEPSPSTSPSPLPEPDPPGPTEPVAAPGGEDGPSPGAVRLLAVGLLVAVGAAHVRVRTTNSGRAGSRAR